MITWMQKHKRYLIITIWISTIAFIAAGMVGWGAYSFSTSSGALAKVGDIAINADDFNREYNFLFNTYNEQYQQLNGMPLDREQAKALGLEDLAMQRLIHKALLENFALDMGIRVSDEEVASEIREIETFWQNGAFDNTLYKEVLKQNRMKPSDFEENMKKDMLIQRALSMFPAMTTPLEREILSIPERLENRISIQVITSNQVKVDLSDAALEQYYEANKNSFKTPRTFEVIMLTHELSDISVSEADLHAYYDENKALYMNDDGSMASFEEAYDDLKHDFQSKEAQRAALKEYVNLKDEKLIQDSKIISEGDISYGVLEALNAARDGDSIKPILDGDKFVTFKLIKKIPQEIESFSDAKSEVLAAYRPIAQKEALRKEAENKINIFRGNDIGFVSINAKNQVAGLSFYELQQLLSVIFNSKKSNGFVMFDDRVALYKVLEQKMLKDSAYSAENRIFSEFKSQIVEQTIVDFLSKQYKIINNFKKDS